ncbi:MAG: 6-phosphogluconolactonase, partial [Clostridia bacterium]|nr:6-phosphogluconolactonase [Clostridia bacterium]
MNFIKVSNYEEMSDKAAEIIISELKRKKNYVLGLATGSTPIGTYKRLIESNKKGEIDFSEVTTVNLDEYVGLDVRNENSYRYFMNDQLFNHVNIDMANTHVPNG